MMGSGHTTPKTVSVIQPMFDDCMSQFANLRGEWMKRSLGVMVNRVDEIDEGGIWEGGRAREKVRGLISLWEVMVVILEVGLALP
jgi:exocyst complex protein 7